MSRGTERRDRRFQKFGLSATMKMKSVHLDFHNFVQVYTVLPFSEQIVVVSVQIGEARRRYT